jgi:magnesium transporter
MQGFLPSTDIVDVVSEEASEDLHKVGGGMEVLRAPYLEIAFWQMIRKRAGWPCGSVRWRNADGCDGVF